MTDGVPVRRRDEAAMDAGDLLREAGWEVLKSAASRAGVDLVAFRETVALVRVKAGRMGRVTPAEWNALLDLAVRAGGVPLVACRLAVPGPIGLYRIAGRKSGSTGGRAPFEVFDPAVVWPTNPRLSTVLRAVA